MTVLVHNPLTWSRKARAVLVVGAPVTVPLWLLVVVTWPFLRDIPSGVRKARRFFTAPPRVYRETKKGY